MAEIGHMRALLGEMRRLSAAEAPTKLQGMGFAKVWNEDEAPTKLQGFGIDKWWNVDRGHVGARYVLKMCKDLLSHGDDRVPWHLRKSLHDLLNALILTFNGHNEKLSRNNVEAASQQQRQRDRVIDIYERYTGMLPEFRQVVNTIVTTTGLDWEQARAELSKQTQQPSKISGFKGGDKAGDEFAVALSAFLTAIHLYLNKNIKDISTTWNDEIAPVVPKQPDPPAYVPTDEEKARVTEVAVRLLTLRKMLQRYYKKSLKWDPENCFVSMIFECSEMFWQHASGDGTDAERKHWLTYEQELKLIQEKPAYYLKPTPVISKLERAFWHPKIQYNADLVREFDETCRLVHLWFGDPDWQSKITRKQAIMAGDFRTTVSNCLFWLSEILPKDSLFEDPGIIKKNDAFRKALRSCVDLFYDGNEPKDLDGEQEMRLINRCNLQLQGLETLMQQSTFSQDMKDKFKVLKDYITSYLFSPTYIESTVAWILKGTEDMFADIAKVTAYSTELKENFVDAYGDSDKKEDALKAFTQLAEFVNKIKKNPNDDSKNLIAFVVKFCLGLCRSLNRCPPGVTLDGWIKQQLRTDYISMKEDYMKDPVVKLVRAYCVAVETLSSINNWGEVKHYKDYKENDRVDAYTRQLNGILSSTNEYLSGPHQKPTREDIEAIMKKITSLRNKLETDKYKGLDQKRVENLMEDCRVALKAYIDYEYPE